MMPYYALVKDSTTQVISLGSVPSWATSPPAGHTAVVLTNRAIPDPQTDYDPVRKDGKLKIGEGGIVTVESGALRRMTNTEINTYLLPAIKSIRMAQIDKRTEELRAIGWEYPATSGDYYSLTAETESLLNGAFGRRSDGDFPFPFRIARVDNSGILELANATAIDNAHKQFFTALNTLIESGLALKNQVLQASTAAEVLAVNDTR